MSYKFIYSLPPMRFPASTPIVFSSAKAFVELHGNAVWIELCDNCHMEIPLPIKQVAAILPTIAHYANPARYLKAVLFAIKADYQERPDEYEHNPPFIVIGNQMKQIILPRKNHGT
jgi:hypothetical protein